MTTVPDSLLRDVHRLVDEYRDRCLWFLRPGYYPSNTDETLRTLALIERHGDVHGFRVARELSECLLQVTSVPSAE